MQASSEDTVIGVMSGRRPEDGWSTAACLAGATIDYQSHHAFMSPEINSVLREPPNMKCSDGS